MIQTKTLKEALKDPGVIEVVEELLPTASSTHNGLLDKKFINGTSLTIPAIDGAKDANELYKQTGSGLTVYIINSEWLNTPYGGGVLFNIQRQGIGNAGQSQHITQLAFSPIGVYSRYGGGNSNTNEISWKEWEIL